MFTEVLPMAAIIARIDDLRHTPTNHAATSAQGIMEELLNVLQYLAQREEALKKETTAHRWLPIFPVQQDWPIQFSDIITGNFFTHLWAFQMICTHNIIDLTLRYPCLPKPTGMRGLDDLLNVKTINQLALLTFRSIEFLLQRDFKLYGAASIILPLKTACDVFKAFGANDPELALWFRRVLAFIKETGYYFLIQIFGEDE